MSGNENIIVSVDESNSITIYDIKKKCTIPFDINYKEYSQQIFRMKLSRYTNHIALQTKKEIILLDYSKNDKVETVNLKITNFM